MADSEVKVASFLDELVDKIIDEFIVGGAANLTAEIQHLLTTLMTLYVVLWGLRMMAGQTPARGLITEFARVSVVLLLLTNFDLYNRFVKEPLLTLPEYMAAVVTGAERSVGLIELVDQVLSTGWEVGATYWSEGSLFSNDLGLYMVAIMIWLCVVLPTVLAVFLLILSKLYLGALLVLGPLVVALTLFERTRGYFERWIAEIVTRCLVILFAVLVPKIMLFYFQDNLEHVRAAFESNDTVYASLVVILFFSLSQILFYWQIPVVASAIAGGFQLAPHGMDYRVHRASLSLPTLYNRFAEACDRLADHIEERYVKPHYSFPDNPNPFGRAAYWW